MAEARRERREIGVFDVEGEAMEEEEEEEAMKEEEEEDEKAEERGMEKAAVTR